MGGGVQLYRGPEWGWERVRTRRRGREEAGNEITGATDANGTAVRGETTEERGIALTHTRLGTRLPSTPNSITASQLPSLSREMRWRRGDTLQRAVD